MQQYERALKEDPKFALAWARLSIVHIHLYFQLAVDRTDARRLMAFSAARRALELRPDLPGAHLALAWYHYHGHRDYDAALLELAIAEQGMPGDPELFETRAAIHRRRGQWEQSLTTMKHAIELDPRNAQRLFEQGNTYLVLRDYVGAERYYDRALKITPDAVDAFVSKARIPLWRDGDVASLKVAAEHPTLDRETQLIVRWDVAFRERAYDTALTYLDGMGPEGASGVSVRNSRRRPKASYYGLAHELAGRPEMAKEHFQIARAQLPKTVEADPSDPWRVLLPSARLSQG